jgi:hypothetical protein
MKLRYHHDTVTHWATSPGSFSGFSFGTPTKQSARWEQKAEQFRTPEGEETVSASIAYLERDVNIGDFLVLGDFTEVSDPTTIPGATRVRQFRKVSNLRNVSVERKAYL